ncbi:tetraacyldisaccharide 4'-kinase [Candidatus Blochmanniella pennsylvanica str. BPEN]|uniref:Tetraacyldisaccharide 4'-kinase n=1 Tax=Blochmanniella pennsylvanica (strain BPEN) TaxID=291272 RepID=LPXK_BLOPB|nr:tetraacyldisaccharide 4'-kinase [Candidatus Blochmannia pennsylvanicus]Q492T0.1 RecName: Full=Tetraacyldisaccharide 4'-kinase; AltName: Full=Lipid A 4'-kinase [Candidatus Blochmannia pennsylvanicus str. BPEN]AAZ41013.1 tetraacyldisaccharide 4'-kinase [Candidatus Blochmannia pennsylvanicus str. BPEN]UOY04228.1 tetraacyldisaccharide 4'-kinase [Candidatus Blochmannia pennsylvanicus]
MFDRIWFKSSFFYLFLLPFSWLYGVISTLNRISYQYGWRKVYRFSVPIIIIGNLTIGGNGKTPMVLWLVEHLKRRGWKVGVISRGYKGKSNNYPIIINMNSHSEECGDEPMLIWKRTGVSVAVSPKRADAVAALLRKQELDIIISDDGLQHYALFRDIEWVIVNSVLRFGNGCWLPAGPMRERINRLHTVQAIIANGSEVGIQSGEVLMQLFPIAVVNILTGERKPLYFLNNVVAIAGIGYPTQFFDTLRSYGIIPIRSISFSDHHVYSEKMLTSLTKKDEILLMTEKDAVKCIDFAHDNWWYVHTEVKINKIDTHNLLSMVENKIRYYKGSRYNVQ